MKHEHMKHKERMHESKHDHKPRAEYADNRMVSDNHQQGIKRVMQRPGDMMKGQGGKMGCKGCNESNWKRGGSLTPRQA